MSQHTPGPWKASEFIREAGLEIVAEGQCIARAYPILQRDANAQLIAAAPELLAALKEAIEFCQVNQISTGNRIVGWKRAIAHATGGR